MSMNHIAIMGRLTADPTLRYTQTNKPVASFTVACDRDFGQGADGKKTTDFIECVAWQSTGEFVSKYFSKGRAIALEGSLQSRKWQDKDGNNRTSWEVNVQHVYFADSKPQGQTGAVSTGTPAAEAQPASVAFSDYDDGDGELPF